MKVTLVGARVGDPHARAIPSSTPSPCSVCAHPTNFSAESRKAAAAYGGEVEFFCVECADLTNHRIDPPTPAQVAEVAAAGHDPTSWPLSFAWGKVVKRHESG